MILPRIDPFCKQVRNIYDKSVHYGGDLTNCRLGEVKIIFGPERTELEGRLGTLYLSTGWLHSGHEDLGPALLRLLEFLIADTMDKLGLDQDRYRLILWLWDTLINGSDELSSRSRDTLANLLLWYMKLLRDSTGAETLLRSIDDLTVLIEEHTWEFNREPAIIDNDLGEGHWSVSGCQVGYRLNQDHEVSFYVRCGNAEVIVEDDGHDVWRRLAERCLADGWREASGMLEQDWLTVSAGLVDAAVESMSALSSQQWLKKHAIHCPEAARLLEQVTERIARGIFPIDSMLSGLSCQLYAKEVASHAD